ncbi:adenylate/guanylate cyclase domain-containing protein [Actinomadura sp. WMMB 499]|uniref:adenylate/guanylate cyclase domain-containing protein n=1 Tax=Actinomadura sp. WMMB 499 TaxID=1219491 RepID=UPI00124410F2|nr:adenylate/guanylate cyclase domain-containing protein [Actinomadura sp. WMMB 499]QFG20051.1 adenylate/guanylate cyclase domain-containing protein [Actinomadura sp. WMMB 499]
METDSGEPEGEAGPAPVPGPGATLAPPTAPRPRRTLLGPLWRLIDGRPGDSRAAVARRARILVTVATGLANLGGALVVVVFGLVVPDPVGGISDRLKLINLVVFTAYVAAALPVGLLLGERFFRRVHRLLQRHDEPRNRASLLLYGPLRLMGLHLTLWGIGTVGWVLINLPFSWLLAVKLGLTSLLGGLTTCTFVYLITERLLRRAVTTALRSELPRRTGLPGVVARSVLAWAFGTAVPILGLITLAVGSFLIARITVRDFAVAVLTLGGIALIVGFLVTYGAARAIADPVESVRHGLARVQHGDLDVEVPVYDAGEVGLLQAGFNHMASGLREHERLRDLFGRQVGADAARVAVERGVDLGGELREVAVLFVDIIGSTRLAADRPPAEVVKLLNDFFAVVVEVVGAHGGWINKFEGDAALAIFGAPLDLPDAPARALAAGRELAVRLRAEVGGLEAAVGVSAGEAVAGHIGAEERFEYTVIGDPVNEAARLTDLAKTTPARLLAAGTLVDAAGPDEAARWSLGDEVVLRGRTRPTRLAAPADGPS